MNNSENPSAHGNGLKKSSGIAIAALLIFGAVAGVMVFHPTSAFASTSITTSSPKFFGPGFLRVVIIDTSKNQGTDTIVPLIEVKRGGTTIGTSQPTIQNIGSSGTFELFVTTSNGPLVPASPSYSATPNQTPGAGATGAVAQGPYVVRVNSGPPTTTATAMGSGKTSTGATATFGANNIPININGANPSNLQDGDSIVITYGGQQTTAQFGRSQGIVTTDRVTVGDGGNIYVQIKDQDAVIDPTNIDQFPANQVINGQPLLQGLIGTNNIITFDANAMFRETGQGTGVFELLVKAQSGNTAPQANGAALPNVNFPQSVTFKAMDMDVYNALTGATSPYDTSKTAPSSSTSSASVTLQNVDGALSLVNPATVGNGLQISVNDGDGNVDSRTRDTLNAGVVAVTVAGIVPAQNAPTSASVQFQETNVNSGIFVPGTSNNRIPINIVAQGQDSYANNAINISPQTLASDPDVTIVYHDPAGQPNGGKDIKLVTKIAHAIGSMSGPSTVGVTQRFNLNMTAPDLNLDSTTVASYVVNFNTADSAAGVDFGPGNLGHLSLKVRGQTVNLQNTPLIVTFIETGPNTGVFTATNIDMSIINNAAHLNDGDQVEFKWTDNGQSPVRSSSATLSVGKPSVGISVDRTTVPIPIDGTAQNGVKLQVTIVDPLLDNNPSSVNTPTLVPPTQGNPSLGIQVTQSDGTTKFAGTQIIPGLTDPNNSQSIPLNGVTFTETSAGSGVFTATLTINGATTNQQGNGAASPQQLNNAKVKLTYTQGTTTSSASFTFRAYDAIVTSDKSIVKNGDNVTISVNDLNMVTDPTIAQKITATIQGKSDDIGNQIPINDLTETGLGSGVFTKTLIVGKDFPIGDILTTPASPKFATQVQVHYMNLIASDGTLNVDRELDLQSPTHTGSITLVPTVVGPGTKISILVNDTDLSTNPAGVITTPQGMDYLRITSDRTGAGTYVGAQGKEIKPGAGSFKTTIKFSPIAAGQAQPGNGWIGGAQGGKSISNMFVMPGDIVSIKYTDQKDASGSKTILAKTFKIQSFDPVITADKTSVSAGDQVKVTVTDPDANIDGEAIDSISLRVFSTTDPVGITVTALETGPNTGVFTALIPTTSSVSTGSLSVKDGDNVTVKYTDRFPADYADRVKQIVDPSKDFLFNIAVGATGGNVSATSTTPSKAVTKDISGNALSMVTSGSQVILSSDIMNNNNAKQPFAAIVEVRDSNGFTQYLQWQTGTLNPTGTANVGLSWTPDVAGTYNVRVFVLSSVSNPAALSPVAESTITVS